MERKEESAQKEENAQKEKSAQREEERAVCRRMRAVPEPLIAWYESCRRDLPWRNSPTPYRVWISEIMLQQTRIEVVRGYFDRFTAALPDVNALAGASRDQVFKLWEGLGYYSRAKNLMRAAEICRDRYGGDLPHTYEELRALPGIGPYTAGAIGSIALGLQVPAVDGNVLRVLSRLLADGSDTAKTAVRRKMETRLAAILPPGRAGVFNEALMELGETVCLPGGRPLCEICPLSDLCLARERRQTDRFPVKSPPKPRPVEKKTILVISCGSRFALHRRPEKGLLAGLFEWPSLPGWPDQPRMEKWVEENLPGGRLSELPRARHVFSHREWEMQGWRIILPEEVEGEWFYAEAQEIREKYPLPTAFRTYSRCLEEETPPIADS